MAMHAAIDALKNRNGKVYLIHLSCLNYFIENAFAHFGSRFFLSLI